MVTFCQIIYDVLPVFLITHQHHSTFKNETSKTTETLLRGTYRDVTQLMVPEYADEFLEAPIVRKSSYSEVNKQTSSQMGGKWVNNSDYCYSDAKTPISDDKTATNSGKHAPNSD